jgi:hypothetical protein
MICQFESLHKLKRHYDVVVIDECTSFFFHTTSETMKPTLEKSLSFLGIQLKTAHYVYGVDADLSPEIVSLMCLQRPHDPPYVVHYTHKPLSNRMLYLAHTRKELLTSLWSSLLKGENCVLVLQSIKDSTDFFAHFSAAASSILLINSEGASYFSGNQQQYKNCKLKKQEILTDLEHAFPPVQLFIYTPCIKTGVSFEKVHFDKVYAMTCRKSSKPREFQQALLRVRHVSSNQYILCLGNVSLGDLNMNFFTSSQTQKQKRKLTTPSYALVSSKFNTHVLPSFSNDKKSEIYGQFHPFIMDLLSFCGFSLD